MRHPQGGGEIGSLAMDGMVELGSERIIDDANERDQIVDEAKRNANIWVGVNEICGAVDRIDNESWSRSEVKTRVIALFP